MPDDIAAVVSPVYKLLEPLEKQDRNRVIKSVLALFDDGIGQTPSVASQDSACCSSVTASEEFQQCHPLCSKWMTKHNIQFDLIEKYFHYTDGEYQVIDVDSRLSSKRDKTKFCYLMSGIARFLSTGKPSFSDKEARGLCTKHGTYDSANHSKFLKSFKNLWTEDKDKNLVLTVPGQDAAAEYLRVSKDSDK